MIGDGRLQAVDADGSRRPVQAMADGEVRFREVAGAPGHEAIHEAVHEAMNVGETPWRNIVVELKEPRPAVRRV